MKRKVVIPIVPTYQALLFEGDDVDEVSTVLQEWGLDHRFRRVSEDGKLAKVLVIRSDGEIIAYTGQWVLWDGKTIIILSPERLSTYYHEAD